MTLEVRGRLKRQILPLRRDTAKHCFAPSRALINSPVDQFSDASQKAVRVVQTRAMLA